MNSNGHILIIDDEAGLRQTLARIFQRAGFEATTVGSGKEGLTIISQQLFDLVYLDIRMPDISGLDVLKTIHAQFPELPVILFTAQPDLHSAVEALRPFTKQNGPVRSLPQLATGWRDRPLTRGSQPCTC